MRTEKERQGGKEKASIFPEKMHPMNISKESNKVTERKDRHSYTEGKMILAECVHSLM